MKIFFLLLSSVIICFSLPAKTFADIITFEEGLDNLQPIDTIHGVVFSPGWTVFADSDEAGGSGNFANEPSPSTTAAFYPVAPALNGISLLPSSQANQQASFRQIPAETRIIFPATVNSVSFYYSLDTTQGTPNVYFYDSNDNLLGTILMDVCGSTFCGAACSGDPTGDFCAWSQISFQGQNISYMEFDTVAAGFWAMDNLRYRASGNISVPAINTWGMIIFIIIAGLGSIYYLRKIRISGS